MKRIIIALIALMVLSQFVSANSIGSKVNIICQPITITGISITDTDNTTDGFQVEPVKPPCLDVVKCNTSPSSKCCGSCGCFYLANGSFVGGNGTHCAIGYGPGYQPVGFTACEYDPPYCTDSPWNNGCDFDSNGSWVGNNEGGYTYDINDGYTMGLKKVMVNVTINASAGIKWVCTNYLDGGRVTMKVDNYDSQKGTQKIYTLIDPPECDNYTGVQSATWTGYFYMHYWEKPGKYTVTVSAESCCKAADKMSELFEYEAKAGLCIAPPGRDINFGDITACGSNESAVANGDYIQSNCGQCDLCSEPPTIRNLGNVMVNLGVYATDMMISNNGGNGDRIPVSHTPGGPYGAVGYQQGVLWINVGTGWNDLQDKEETIALPPQIYCNRTEQGQCPDCNDITVYYNGLAPGPHATNNLSLMMWPIPCAPTGQYSNSLYVSAIPADDVCCQDHREPYFGSSECITPPQCYEVPGRYPYGTACVAQGSKG